MGKQLQRVFGAWIAVMSLCLVLGIGMAEAGQAGQAGQAEAGQAEAKININTAPIEVLQTLPEVGPIKAAAIIAFRTVTPFTSIEDIKKVPGIGDATFEKLKGLITVE